MAASLKNSRLLSKLIIQKNKSLSFQQSRNRIIYRNRGRPVEEARSYQQRVEDLNKKDGVLDARVNIGLALKPEDKLDLKKIKENKRNAEFERKSRRKEIVLPEDVINGYTMSRTRQEHYYNVLDLYGIYAHLFGEDAYFYPQTVLDIAYPIAGDTDLVQPVYYGNELTPTQTQTAPYVTYEADPDKLYTLCMVAPDSHLQNNDMEYLLWMVGNIPGCDIGKGTLFCDYLRPFPVKGTGCHRYVFILYQQEQPGFEAESCFGTSLNKRSFSTLEFYRKHEQDLTPVGVAFFQAEYDKSVRGTFHNVLDMPEPRYEFIHPLPYREKMKKWPIREAFNFYMDEYRDNMDINEEVLREKLRTADPFKPRPSPRKYPNVFKTDKELPSWLQMKENEKRQRLSYWKALDD